MPIDIPITLGAQGWFGHRNTDLIPTGGLTRARNVRYVDGILQKSGGLSKVDSNAISGDPVVLAGHDWNPTDSIQRQVVAASDGSIYREDVGDMDASTYKTGLTFTDPVVFTEGGQEALGGNRKLFMFSKGVVPQYIDADAASMTALTNFPSGWTANDYPRFAINHDGRVYAFLDQTCYPSKTEDHSNFNSGSVFQVGPSIGTHISAAISAIPAGQQLSQLFYTFKSPRGVMAVDTTNVVGLFIPTRTVSLDVGCVGPRAVTQAENDILFISENGHIYSLLAVETEKNVDQADLTTRFRLDQWTRDNVSLSPSRLKHAVLFYDSRLKELWAMFTSKTSDRNAVGFVVSMEERNNPKVSFEDRGEFFEAMWAARSSLGQLDVYHGGEDGFIYKANQDSRSVGSTLAYTGEWELPETDFSWFDQGLKRINKEYLYFTLTVLPTGAYDLGLTFTIDGKTWRSDTMSLGSTGSALDVGRLDTDFVLGGQTTVKHTVPIGGIGERLGVRATNGGLNESFEIIDATITLEPFGRPGEQ